MPDYVQRSQGAHWCTNCEERLTPVVEPVVHASDCPVPELERLRAENDAMRQLFQVWLLVDSLSWQERADLARRTIELGGPSIVDRGRWPGVDRGGDV